MSYKLLYQAASLSFAPLRLCVRKSSRKGAKAQRKRNALYLLVLLSLFISFACRSRSGGNASEGRGVIVVNAPATGTIRRVLVSEGTPVNEGAELFEIAVATEGQTAAPTQAEDPQARAARNVTSTQSEIEAARAEVVRTEVEVNRLTPLVASGEAPQAQLDGARAEYERAQQRLQRARSSEQTAEAGLVAARQKNANAAAPTVQPTEQIVTARASSAGTVSAISVQVGAHVTSGQPLATLRAE